MRGFTILLACCCCMLVALVGKSESFTPPAGPYDIEVTRAESCEDEGTRQIHFESKLSNNGKGKYIYSSPFWLLVPIDDTVQIAVDIQQYGNGGYKPHSIDYNAKNCEDIWKIGKDFVVSLWKSAGVELNSCPIPAGNYTADNWEVEVKLNNVPTMNYSKNKIVVTLTKDGEKIGCHHIYINIVPKKMMTTFG